MRADDCAFDLPVLDVEVSGGRQTNRFSYYAGASHLPEVDPVIIDTLVQFNTLSADGG